MILDEVQKVPALLDEVHWLIENRGLRFVLCGSSARKLQRGDVNLLGGRAWRYEMHPLVSHGAAAISTCCGRSTAAWFPPTTWRPSTDRSLRRRMCATTSKEEVFDEGLTRNVAAFSRFFEAVGFSHGDLTNYANIARDCGVDAEDGQGVLPDPRRHAAGQFRRALQAATGTAGDREGRQVLPVRRRVSPGRSRGGTSGSRAASSSAGPSSTSC